MSFLKCKIVTKSRSKLPEKYLVEQGKGTSYADNTSLILLSKETSQAIGFKEITFSTRDMCIRRASSIGHTSKKIRDNRISIPYNEELEGEYFVEKLDEDTFKLYTQEEWEEKENQ